MADDVTPREVGCGIGVLGILVVGGITLGMWGCPQYTVYHQTKAGEARLREAESSREIAVVEAKAKMEAAEMLAQAEVARAKGIAAANKIIGDSLKDNPEYLTWLWIDKMDLTQGQVIYVPTEAGLPIIEAGRMAERARVAREKRDAAEAAKKKE